MFSLIDFCIFSYSIIQLLFLIHIVLLFVLSFFSICLVIQSEAKDLGGIYEKRKIKNNRP